jgi:two-component sensor histidine kinase
LSSAATIDEYVELVEGRIGALARAHVLLSASRWTGADLHGIVGEELAPYCIQDAEKITAGGPRVRLQPAVAQALALALHELSTNAAKYGALSVKSGTVAVSWKRTPRKLELQWVETGVPFGTPQPS